MIDTIISIEKIDHTSPRYDLTVKDNLNFFANNILVHNCQSNPSLIEELRDKPVYISVKADGTSGTFILYDDEEHVCSRNMSLKENDDNTYWIIYKKYKIRDIIDDWRKKNNRRGLAIQGEIVGPGIQKNPMGYTEPTLLVFNIYDIEEHRHFGLDEMQCFCMEYGLTMVPIESQNIIFDYTLDGLLKMAEGKYDNGREREGIVIRTMEPVYSPTLRGRLSCKAINNRYLLHEK